MVSVSVMMVFGDGCSRFSEDGVKKNGEDDKTNKHNNDEQFAGC